MKKLLLLLSLIPFMTVAQKPSCCTNPHAEFARLGNSETFAMAHVDPQPINFQATRGEMITLPASGQKANAFYVKAPKGGKKWLLVFHEWWGLNDHIKREAENLSDRLPDFNILALDLYDGKLATTADSAQKLMANLDERRARSIITAAMKHIGPDVPVGTIGWCMGGGWSMQSALMLEKQAKACVIYYGMPETNPEKLAKLSAPVLGIFASKDEFITPEVVDQFNTVMKENGKELTLKMYDAVHAFANPSNPEHNEKYMEEALNLSVEFLSEHVH